MRRRPSLLPLALALAACATTPEAPPMERWRADLDAYLASRAQLAVDIRQVLDDFQALGAEPSFASLDAELRTLGVRVRQGEEPDDAQTLVRGLWSLSLPELALFERYLALSSRVLELEAREAELEATRLDLWHRRLTWGGAGEPPPDPLAQPVERSFACARHHVGRVEFVSCREPVRP